MPSVPPPTAPAVRVWVTRPEPEASDWVQRLRVRGWDAQACPLLALTPSPLPADLPGFGALAPAEGADATLARALAQWHALMFVSAQAVDFFWRRALALPPAAVAQAWAGAQRPRCWGPGPATAAALCAAGVPPALIDAPPHDAERFDSQALWPRVADQAGPGRRLLLVRGALSPGSVTGVGRDELAQRWQASGGEVALAEVYRREAPAGLPERLAACAADGAVNGPVVWVFTSAEALGHFQRHAPPGLAPEACALVTHPRMEPAARAAGFGRVWVCRSSFEDVCTALESALRP